MTTSPALSQLLHAALEPRASRLRELSGTAGWQEDSETLHQVRIASRRVRAVLDLMDPEQYPGFRRQQRHLRRLTRTLSLTRELDVHAEVLEALRTRATDTLHQAALDFLLEDLDRKRRKARKAMARALGRIAPKDLVRPLDWVDKAEAPLDEGLSAAAWTCLEPRLLAVDQAVPGLLDREEVQGLHQLRIHVKRLRYTLEVLEPAFPRPLGDLLQDLKTLQSELGSHHDHAVLEAHLRKLQAALAGRGRATLAGGLLELTDLIAERRREHYARFGELGRRHHAEDPSQHLRRMLGVAGSGPA